MNTLSPALSLLLNLAVAQAVTARRFEGRLGGLSLSEFLLLHHLSQADGESLRRIDLAERIGLTASGVTRMLAPMEKIGLVRRDSNPQDARVSLVTLAPGGKRQYQEAIENAEELAGRLLSGATDAEKRAAGGVLVRLGGTVE